MPIDLLPIGETLAELDLVVRQLDDGSLSVTTDDALPDGARVRLAPSGGQGLRAWLQVVSLAAGQGSRVAASLGPVNQAIAGAGGRGALMVRGNEVRFEVDLEHLPPYTGDELQALYRAVVDGGAAQRPTVARIVAEAAPTLVAPAPAPDDGAPLPSSYLPGAGQRPRESATERFGRIGAVPGRAELAPEDRARPAAGRGGGGVVLMVVGLLGLTLVAAAGFGVMKLREGRQEDQETPKVDVATKVAPLPPPADGGATTAPDEAPGQGQDPMSSEPLEPGPTPRRPSASRPTSSTPPKAPAAITEEQALAGARDPAKRADAVEAWLAAELDRAPGARARMLEALEDGVEADAKVGRLIMQSLRDRPPSTAEAIACLEVADGVVKRALVHALAEASGPDAEQAAAALSLLEDTPDLVVDEALLRLGRPRDGAPLRLATARGPDWVLYGDGRPLLEALAKRDVKQLASLLKHDDVEVRMSACALIVGADQPRDALALLAPVLRDAEPRVRERAAEGLAALRDPRASWPLARALTREDSNQTRDVIIDGLQRLPLKETVELLGRLYGSADAGERRAAVMGFNAIGKPEAVTGLVAALRDADRAVRLEALRALDAAYGKPALRPRVSEGLAAIRELGLDRADREVWSIARQLHYQITGRMPDATVRDRGTR